MSEISDISSNYNAGAEHGFILCNVQFMFRGQTFIPVKRREAISGIAKLIFTLECSFHSNEQQLHYLFVH